MLFLLRQRRILAARGGVIAAVKHQQQRGELQLLLLWQMWR
jgi:hypothetical protein